MRLSMVTPAIQLPASCNRNASEIKKPSPMYLCVLFMTLLGLSFQTHARECSPAPSADLSPQNVVKAVVEALQDNDIDDNGIFTVYCFASPGNKSNTGPLERFASMIKKGFPDMLNHEGSYFEEMKIEGSVALQPVWLTTSDGKEVGYMFKMGKQLQGEFKGMWMTDGVFPMRPDAKREQSI